MQMLSGLSSSLRKGARKFSPGIREAQCDPAKAMSEEATKAPSIEVKPQPAFYGLDDQQYGNWKRVRAACRKSPMSIDSLRVLGEDKQLLNWRSPVDGQTLLHELVAAGADDAVIQQAVEIGCDLAMPNSQGVTAQELVNRKKGVMLSSAYSRQSTRSRRLEVLPSSSALRRQNRRSQTYEDFDVKLEPPVMSQPTSVFAPGSSAVLQGNQTKVRRKGLPLPKNEKASMPKAKINLDLDLRADDDFDEAKLQAAVQRSYGGSARVQIDQVADKLSAGPQRRVQNLKCRVLFDDVEEARGWQNRSSASRVVQENIATNMQLQGEAVQFDAPSKMDEVDSVTLKLDSDSSNILCGACLLYDLNGHCEKVVHYSDRFFSGGAVQHSGDTQVDSKSVHTISFVQSKIPIYITRMYFTLCSCGPEDLSGFRNPSIMLYDHSEPDANLLEYSIDKAGKSPSCVMAELSRRPKWSHEERIDIACALRRKGMPFLCVDMCLAMASETSWDVKALGTEEWYLGSKICGDYTSCKQLIEEKWRKAA